MSLTGEHLPITTPEQPEKLWYDGPNYTADAVIINAVARRILLIQRKDTQWALPGGFVDPDEEALDAAKREAWEETVAIPIRLGLKRRPFYFKL